MIHSTPLAAARAPSGAALPANHDALASAVRRWRRERHAARWLGEEGALPDLHAAVARALAAEGSTTEPASDERAAAGPLPPRGACVASGEVVRDPALAPWLADAPPFAPGRLIGWLMAARFGRLAPPLTPWVVALPSVPPPTALGWARAPAPHLLEASAGQSLLGAVLELFFDQRQRLAAVAPGARPVSLEGFTLGRYLWAAAIVATHARELGDPVVDLALGPLEGTSGEGALGARATTSDAGLRVPFPLPPGVPLTRDKSLWLLAQRDEPVEVTLGPASDPTRFDRALDRARWYALDRAELARLGVSAVHDAWPAPGPLSPSGEARARELVHAWLKARQGPTPTDPTPTDSAIPSPDPAALGRAAYETFGTLARAFRTHFDSEVAP